MTRDNPSRTARFTLPFAGGAGLLAAAWALRRLPAPVRLALGVAGGFQIGRAVPALIPPAEQPVGYAPLDIPKRIADGVFIVDSILPGPLGRVLPVRMTVIRLDDGSVLLHSPTRHTPALQAALTAIGPVRHLVAPNIAHWTLLDGWQHACPAATTWAVPALRDRGTVRRAGLRLDCDLGDVAPSVWGDTVTLRMIPGGLGFQEAALFHTTSRTLVLTDLVLNLELDRVPVLLRPVIRLFGSASGKPPPYLRGIVKLRRQAARAAVLGLLALDPERVVFAHGAWFADHGAHRLRQAMDWLVDA